MLFRIIIFTSYSSFADRASIFPFEPFGDALCMESVQTWQYYVLFFHLITALTNGTLFILLGKVKQIGFSELCCWQSLQD